MKYTNPTNQTIMLRDHKTQWTEWIKFSPGDTKEVNNFLLAEKLGLIQTKTIESTIGEKKVETKVIEEHIPEIVKAATKSNYAKPIKIPKKRTGRKYKR